MVTPLSTAGATARALGPFEEGGVAVMVAEDLLVLTDFPDCFSIVLDCTATGFDATTGFFVACVAALAAFVATGFAGALFAAGLTALLTGLFAGLLAVFLTTAGGRFAFAAAFAGALRALLAATRATGLARAGAFAFFA
ncbi:MAG TPA: hypothetical protein VKB52_11865 [Rhodanobacteraceae bacterium]|nr:hypothetical protein [Rhodanobacteraceae bacterium]